MLSVTPIVGFCNCSMFCCALLYVHSIFTIMRKRELVALLCLSSWCLVIVVWLFHAMPRVCLQLVIVVFPDHTHLLFFQVMSSQTGTIYQIEKKIFILQYVENKLIFFYRSIQRMDPFGIDKESVGTILDLDVHFVGFNANILRT